MKRTSAKAMSLRETKARLSEAIDVSQGAYVLITRHGKPAAVLLGVEGLDTLDVAQRFAGFSVRQPGTG